MNPRGAAVAAVSLVALVTPTPAHGETVEQGYSAPDICVVRVDTAARWRVGAAVRAWNAAQSSIRFHATAVPGCDVVEIREFPGPEHPDWNGYVEVGGADYSPLYNRSAYRSAVVWLNHAKLVESFRPKYKGTMRHCWRKRVVAHELGHALGLEHTTGSESVMSYGHDYKAHCGRPSADDAASVAGIYTPVG